MSLQHGNVFEKKSAMHLSVDRAHSDNDTLMKPFSSELLAVDPSVGSSHGRMGGTLDDSHIDESLKRRSSAEGATMAETNGYDEESETFIEIATYAGVDVYECYTKDKPPCLIMRRCTDNWLNITQVFKAGSFTKAQRTKILEKEANEIKHEKIQGGYGRFQGTWIPWDATKYLVEKYNINNKVVKRIVEFIPDPTDLPPRRSKVSHIKKSDPNARISSPSAYKKTPKKNTKTPMKKKPSRRSTKQDRPVQPSPLQNLMFQTPQQQHHLSQASNQSTEKLPTLPSEQDTPMATVSKVNTSMISEVNHPIKYQTTQKPLQFYPYPQAHQFQQMVPATGKAGPNASKMKAHGMKLMKQMMQSNQGAVSMANSSGSMMSNATSTGSSMEVFSAHGKETSSSSTSPTPVPSGSEKNIVSVEYYKELILEVLSSEYDSAEPTLPEALYRPPSNLDINFLIDDQGHTSLHWAVAMSNIPLIRVLLVQDADILRCNDKGFNCLTKSIFYNNCYKAGSFQQIISILNPCLVTPDNNSRLPLHYLVELTVNRSKEPHVIDYYMDTILDLLAKENEKLLRMTLNHQDSMGNTTLHLAALNKNVELCQKLVYFGASPDILNGENQTVSMILSRFTMPNIFQPSLPAQILQSPPKTTFLSNTPRNSQDDDHIEDTTTFDLNDATVDSIQTSSRKNNLLDRNDIYSLDKMKGSLTPSIKVNPPSPSTLLKPVTKTREVDTVKVIEEKKTASNTLKSTMELSAVTTNLVSAIENNLANLQHDVNLREQQIKEIDLQLKNAQSKEKLISESNNKNSLVSLQAKLKLDNIKLDNHMERSQALYLATLVQDEENKVPNSGSSSNDTSGEAKNYAVQLMVELCYKQFKRRHIMKQIKNAKDQLVSDGKISKFRKLIGMSIDNIDSKLNDIEQDLRSMETTAFPKQ